MNIIIVGAGFAGLKLARALNNQKGVTVTLLDKNNFHQFQPLFYQVATAGLDASNISFPLRKIFQGSKNVQVRMGELLEIYSNKNEISTSIGTFQYDMLVLAMGANTNFFGNKQLEKWAFPMKTTVEALNIKYQLLQNLENALPVTDKSTLHKLLSIVVVGGGATGVEVSGALAEMKKNILPKDYPTIDFSQMQIYLLEGGGKTLPAMSEKSSEESRLYLDNLGVKVLTNTIVKDYDGETVFLNNDAKIETKTVIWAAGIKGNIPNGIDEKLIARGNRIKVDRTNKIETTDNIYVLGDLAYMETPKYPNGHPQVANVAINQAKNLVLNIERMLNGNKHYLNEFEYQDKGSMATVGRNLAVVDIPSPKIHLGGFFAWLIWMGLHLMLILGVKNRIQIFVNWIYKYFTKDQSLRLLFNWNKKSPH